MRTYGGERASACEHPDCTLKYSGINKLQRHKPTRCSDDALPDNDQVVFGNGHARLQSKQPPTGQCYDSDVTDHVDLSCHYKDPHPPFCPSHSREQHSINPHSILGVSLLGEHFFAPHGTYLSENVTLSASNSEQQVPLRHSSTTTLNDFIPGIEHPVESRMSLTFQQEIKQSRARNLGLDAVNNNARPERPAIPNLSDLIHNIRGPISGGGSCDIYVGNLRQEDNPNAVEQVAMKMLRVFSTEALVVKAKKKFRREVDVWRSLSHPNVLKFYGTCEIKENRLFMVSAWAQGGNSIDYLRRNPTANRLRILQQTSSALKYLHSGKDIPQVVHGDLKADNVLISGTGDALLCDFGLSRFAEDIMMMTATPSINNGGNVRFMAPELIDSSKDTSIASKPTPASDVFALASLMLQIFTEKPPFSNLSDVQALLQIIKGVLPLRPKEETVIERGLHDDIWALMTDCWEFDARKRPSMEIVVFRMTKFVVWETSL